MANTGFVIFRNVTIPERSRIIKAVVEFTGFLPVTGIDTNVLCYFEDADSPSPPTDKSDLDGRSLTAGVSWKNIEEWEDNYNYQSPQLSAILQEVINRVGWVSGNNVHFLAVDDSSAAYRLWSAIEHKLGTEKARLRVSWIAPPQVETPLISPVETFQLAAFDCVITTFPTDANIYYTTNGTDPDETDTLYTGPFEVSGTTTIKAKAYKQYWTPSEISSKVYSTYSIDLGSYIPVLTDFYSSWGAMYQRGGTIYILYAGSGGYKLANNSGGSWSSEVIEATVGGSYRTFALYIDGSGYAHCLYIDNIDGVGTVKAKYATNASGSWVVTIIDDGYYLAAQGSIFEDSAGYIHCFYAKLISTTSYVRYATNKSGSWAAVNIGVMYGAIRTVTAVMFSDETFAVCYRGSGSELKITEGSGVSWVAWLISGAGIPFWATTSIASYVDGSDNAYFCYARGSGNYTNDLYLIDNEGGSWGYSKIVECGDLREASYVRGLYKDSSGYFHIIFAEEDTSSHLHVWYATNDSGSWVKVCVGRLIEFPNIHEYPLYNAIGYDEGNNKLYSVWRELTNLIQMTLNK